MTYTNRLHEAASFGGSPSTGTNCSDIGHSACPYTQRVWPADYLVPGAGYEWAERQGALVSYGSFYPTNIGVGSTNARHAVPATMLAGA